jgi:phosphoglycerate kinase
LFNFLNHMQSITEYSKAALRGKKVIVRVGFDVPVERGVVINDFRIREALPTLEHLIEAGARVILISHIGRDASETLTPVAKALVEYLPTVFVPEVVGSRARSAVDALADGNVLLLENLRSDAREVGNDDTFARELASYGDVYVNEAFSVAHRSHASIVGIPQYLPHFAGIGFAREVAELTKAFTPTAPSVFVLGGAKFDTKLPLVKKFMNLYDHIYVCGALAHDVWEARGVSVGASLVSDVPLTDPLILTASKVQLPIDVRTQSLDGSAHLVNPAQVNGADVIMDIGPRSVEVMLRTITKESTVLWNGPLGFYERGFRDGTKAFAEGVAASGARAIVGGGDTVASIEELGLNDKFTHVSTAGGAMLEFLEKGTLPGIEALQ